MYKYASKLLYTDIIIIFNNTKPNLFCALFLTESSIIYDIYWSSINIPYLRPTGCSVQILACSADAFWPHQGVSSVVTLVWLQVISLWTVAFVQSSIFSSSLRKDNEFDFSQATKINFIFPFPEFFLLFPLIYFFSHLLREKKNKTKQSCC